MEMEMFRMKPIEHPDLAFFIAGNIGTEEGLKSILPSELYNKIEDTPLYKYMEKIYNELIESKFNLSNAVNELNKVVNTVTTDPLQYNEILEGHINQITEYQNEFKTNAIILHKLIIFAEYLELSNVEALLETLLKIDYSSIYEIREYLEKLGEMS